MKFFRLSLICLFFCSSIFIPCFSQNGGLPVVGDLQPGDVITPFNAEPVPIDTALKNRGHFFEKPSRNLIIFLGSGISDESAALYRSISNKRSFISQMETLEVVLSSWPSLFSKKRIGLFEQFAKSGKSLGLVTDTCLELPSFLFPSTKTQSADLKAFDMVFTGGAKSLKDKDKDWLQNLKDMGFSVSQSFTELNQLFSKKAPKIFGVFGDEFMPTLDGREGEIPAFSELMAASLSRLSSRKEGFILIINFKAVERARSLSDFSTMIDQIQRQERLLSNLSSYVAGRTDTTLMVIAKPENGHWQVDEKVFSTDRLKGEVLSVRQTVSEMLQNPEAAEVLFKKVGFKESFSTSEVKKLCEWKCRDELEKLVADKINSQVGLRFLVEFENGYQKGFYSFVSGAGSEMFHGVSDFENFSKQVERIIGAFK
jgi:alkaline phosphatase